MAAKTGSVVKLGWYPQHMETGFTTMASNQNIKGLSDSEAAATANTPAGLLKKAGDYVTKVHTAFGAQAPSTATIPVGERAALIATAAHVANTNTNGRLIPYFFHPDHLGSSAYVTNRIGVVSQHTEYLPFGETLTDEHINSQSSPFKYNGKHLDEETGNYYYGARYYDPKLSIFISVDPLVEETMSPYTYCYNNPIRFTDPDGEAPTDIIFIVRDSKGKAQTFTYKNGNFYHSNGKRYDPGKESISKDMYKVLSAFRKIESSGDKKLISMLKTLETSKQKHFLESGPKSQVERDPNSMSVSETKEKVMNGAPLDTRTTYNFSEGAKKEFEESTGVEDTPFNTVVHEMQHQFDYDQGKMADSEGDYPSASSPAEIRAVNTENRARKIEGTGKRTTYGGVEIDPKKLD